MLIENNNLVLEDEELNEELIEEDTENVEEQTTEETVDAVTEGVTEEKIYTEEELNDRIDKLLAKKIARKEAKLRKELEKEYQPYKELGTVVNAGLGFDNVNDATNNLREYYSEKGIKIPNIQPTYNENDLKILSDNEVKDIIESGFDEVVEEVDRLAQIGVDNMSPREKLVFAKLAEYRTAESSKRELLSIGVGDDLFQDEEFKNFSKKFNSNTPMKEIYELYQKTQNKKQTEPLGSMKSKNPNEVKDYYSPEEIERLTEEELDNPKIWAAVRRSMTNS